MNKISSKIGGYTENEAKTLDVIITGSMSPHTFENGSYNDFRNDWGVEFDYNTLQKRMERKKDFLDGNYGALVDDSKWENSGNKWNSEAIDLFRNFYKLPSPAVYLDTSGRKVNFTNFDGKKDYDLLYGITPKSIFCFLL